MNVAYICHSGAKGMRWYHRRYQNEDGTLTEAGKRRYYKNYKKYKEKSEEYRTKYHNDKSKENKNYKNISKNANENYIDVKWRDVNNSKTSVDKNDTTKNKKSITVDQLKAVKEHTELAAKTANDLKNTITPKPKRTRMNLSKMTDQELRSKIDRENLELKYNSLFGKDDPIPSGRKKVIDILEGTSAVLGVASTAIGVAMALKKLKEE